MLTKNEHLKLCAVEILNERIERKIIPAGSYLPDVTVKTFDGQEHSISRFYATKLLLLAFMRASWCPYCRAQMEMINGMAQSFKKLGCEIVVVTRETPEESAFSSKEVVLVTDLNNDFGKKLGMTYFATQEITQIYNNLGISEDVEGYFDTSELNVPATFIIVPGKGRIIFKHAKRDYTKRATGAEIITELSRLNN